MQIILEAIQNLLAAIQGHLAEFIALFPGTIVTISLFTIVVRKRILNFLKK